MILSPQEQFVIVRQLSDPADVSGRFVRAVIKNSLTSDTIQTLNLTDQGSGRFRVVYEVPADVSGLGFYIDVATHVYTDSGYTTPDTVYGSESETYLVFNRARLGGSSGGGPDVDYKKIEKMLRVMADGLPKFEKPESLEPVKAQLKDILMEIKAIDIPEPEKLNNTPVIEAITDSNKIIIKAIEDKTVTPVTDLTPVLEKIDKKEPDLTEVFKKIEELMVLFSNFSIEDGLRESAKEKLLQVGEILGPIFTEFKQEVKEKQPEATSDGKDIQEDIINKRAKNLL